MSKNVLITGASRGIGKSIAEKFEKNGYVVIAPTRDELDLTSKTSILDYVEKNKAVCLDTIVNNAGINPIDAVEDIKENDIQDVFQINMIAPLLIIQGFIGSMKQNKKGRIVNIGSMFSCVAREKRTLYCMSKNGIHGLTNTLALELGEHNILVNTICPGYTDTELARKNIPPEERVKIEKKIPLKRFANPEEIAEMVYFLGSDVNTYVTGQKIIIDGGFTAQ
jgi:3-oxoacyl-[acyl-carrier protein] reductase